MGKPRFSSDWTTAPASSSRANSTSSSAPQTAALSGPVSGRRKPFSSTMRITPSAARLSANGSLLPVGFSSIAQKPPSVSSLSASATAIDDRRRRNPVARPLRLVMVLDRGGDARLLALLRRIVAAHQALQLGKLADHFGDEIGLGEARGARRKLDVGADLGRELARQRLDPLDPLGLRAELLVEDDAERLELGEALVERLFGLVLVVGQVMQVGEPEVAGVGKTGAHHPGVAGGDRRAAVARDQVRDQDEAVGEPAVRSS